MTNYEKKNSCGQCIPENEMAKREQFLTHSVDVLLTKGIKSNTTYLFNHGNI